MLHSVLLLAGVVAMDAQHRKRAGVVAEPSENVQRQVGIREDLHSADASKHSLLERKNGLTPTYAWAPPNLTRTNGAYNWKHSGSPIGQGVIASDENFCRHLTEGVLTQQENCQTLESQTECGTEPTPASYTEGTLNSNGQYSLCEWHTPAAEGGSPNAAGEACTNQRGRRYAWDGTQPPAECHNTTTESTMEGCRNGCGMSPTCKYWQYFRGVCDQYEECAGAFTTATFEQLGYNSGECATGSHQYTDKECSGESFYAQDDTCGQNATSAFECYELCRHNTLPFGCTASEICEAATYNENDNACKFYASGQCGTYVDKVDHTTVNAAPGGGCLDGSTHKCPWTVHMKQLKQQQTSQEHSCHSRLLEARRTLDGLLHAVNTTYHEMMADNEKIRLANITIEAALEDHRNAEDKLVTDRQECENAALLQNQSLTFLEADIVQLIDISTPLRSDVSVKKDYVAETVIRATNENAAIGGQIANLDPIDLEKFKFGIVNNVATAMGLGADVTDGTKTLHGYPGSFVELSGTQNSQLLSQVGALDSETCSQMTSLLEKSKVRQKRVGSPIAGVQQRQDFSAQFDGTFSEFTNLYSRINFEIGYNRTYCLKNASYSYNYTILGPDGVDSRITDAAETIHIAQQTIMVLVPRLHDLEHAVTQMREHIQYLNNTCKVDARVTVHLQTIQQLIHDMQECPGRNNFTLSIPHWQANQPATPPPTPFGRAPGPLSDAPEAEAGHVQQATLYDYEIGAARRRGDTHIGMRDNWTETYQGRTYTYSEEGRSPGRGVTTEHSSR